MPERDPTTGKFVKGKPKTRMTKRGRATTVKASEINPETWEGKPEAPAIQIPVKRSQHCLKHNTMKIGGKCRRCEWETKGGPKRDNNPTHGNNVDRTDAGEMTIGD